MPIREIMTFSFGVLAVLFATHGPLHFRESVRNLQIQILRDVARTDNWGNPSIFKHRPQAHSRSPISRVR